MSGIREDVEKKVFQLLSDLGDRVGAERVQQFLEGAVTSAARTKKAVDKNVETLLAMANIPSRRDYDRVRSKLDALQASVVSLNRTVDDLRDRLGMPAAGLAPKPRRTRKAEVAHKSRTPKRSLPKR